MRQQTLRGTIDWSYNLLDAAEQELFARLGVFAGGCTVEAVEVLLAGGDILIDPLNGLASLVDKNLLKQTEEIAGEPRFVMLETIREYALERFAASGEEEAIRQRHAAFFLALAEQAEPWIRFLRPDRDPWMERLTVEHDNLRGALAWFSGREEVELGLRLGCALRSFWVLCYHWSEGRAWLEAALAQSEQVSGAIRGRVLVAAGHLAFASSDNLTACAYAEEALALLRGSADDTAIAMALLVLGSVKSNMGEYALAHTIAEECLALFDGLDEAWGRAQVIWLLGSIALTQGNLTQAAIYIDEMLTLHRQSNTKKGIGIGLHLKGYIAQMQDDWDRAVMFYEESLPFVREVGAKEKTAEVLHCLGLAALRQGDERRAATCFVEELTLTKEIGDRTGIAYGLVGMASTAAASGYVERSVRLIGAAEALFKDIGLVMDPVERAEYDRSCVIARSQLDEATFAAAWAVGAALTIDQAVADALRVGELAEG
jgi:tetratricopeptide (TPR) repeat protein